MASVHQTEAASEAQNDTSIHDGRQLEQSPKEEQGDQSEGSQEAREEDKEDSRTDNGAEEATPVNENPPTTSALSKKEERLRRLRELHLRRVSQSIMELCRHKYAKLMYIYVSVYLE